MTGIRLNFFGEGDNGQNRSWDKLLKEIRKYKHRWLLLDKMQTEPTVYRFSITHPYDPYSLPPL